ncbi:gamma carbonic anhydrase family protein [Thermus scotoductus]|uniref:Gamma carbonic anhydrase family protein n=1 Tax=Thermus scotoductus TaxID=37636 RepID=A0ABY0AFG3_THESC|nr:gamma carbonic anhydrase family protein [Thermus scotoductus]RTH28878.1 gamma carbonic anhydrase family protein [Thermus scotoductus]RTI04830.1 gamma carbonic anhydrase family protein [Thermus scotoductus]
MSVYRFEDKLPRVHPSAFIAPGAYVVGEVEVGEGASIWFAAVVRGDLERVVIGPGSNVQDGAVLHADPGFPCLLGAGVTVGHRAVVPPGMEIPEGALALGVPARVKGPAEPPGNAPRYRALAERYRKGLLAMDLPRRYRLTLRGQDALNPFSELHLHLKRTRKEALEALRRASQGFPLALEEALPLVEEGFLAPE